MFKNILITLFSGLFFSLLFIEVPRFIPYRLILTLWPMGHIMLFSLIVWLFLRFYAPLKTANFRYQFIFLSLTSLVIGISVELIQPYFSRTAEIEDIFSNYTGTLAGIIFLTALPFKKHYNVGLRWVYTGFLLFLISPTFLTAYDEYKMRNDLPVISDYYNQTALTRWRADAPLTTVMASSLATTDDDKPVLRATFISQKASRVVLRHFYDNWSGYQQLQMRFFNPNDTILPLRVLMTDQHYDQAHSNSTYRFEVSLQLLPGWSSHQISLAEIQQQPKARPIDLQKMAGIDFYMYKLKAPETIYIDQIKLLN